MLFVNYFLHFDVHVSVPVSELGVGPSDVFFWGVLLHMSLTLTLRKPLVVAFPSILAPDPCRGYFAP